MQIPEELLKLSEKELRKTLKENIFQAKYIIDFYNDAKGRIIEIEAKIGRYFYFKGISRVDYKGLQNGYYKPLTYDSLQRFRTNNIIEKVNQWSYETFKNWCIKQFNDVYGEQFVDAQDNHIIVHFPEITISNSIEQSHIMRDVYLSFEIGYTRIHLKRLLRGTLTDVEIRNQYTFSHSNNYDNVFEWSTSFCFGKTAIADLKDSLNNKISVVKNLRFFLEAVKEYLSWESLEGTPFRRIDEVVCDKDLWLPIYNSDYDLKDAVNKVLNTIENFVYDIEHYDNEYHILLKSSSVEKIATILGEYYPEQLLYSLNGKSVEKNYLEDAEYDIPEHIYFKGEWKPFKLIKTENTSIELPRKINSTLLANVKEKIEIKFTNFYKQKKLDGFQD